MHSINTQFELIAIDLDGTLADTVGDLHQAVVQMLAQMNRDVATQADVRNWVGNGIERLVHRALTGSMDNDANADLFDVAMPLFEQAYSAANGANSTLYPGVLDGLLWLSQLDVPLVVVTNKARRYAEPLVSALGIAGYFQFLLAGDDVAQKKPDPAALLEAARRCMAAPDHSVLIGDSVTDIKAARAAGFSSISVTYGYNHGVPIQSTNGQWQSDAVIDSFSELTNVLGDLALIKTGDGARYV